MIKEYNNETWEEFELINNKKNGKATYYSNENRIVWNYIDGILQGKATIYYKNGNKEEYVYINGEKQGKSILYSKGTREERNYINGILQGEATLYEKDRFEKRNYVNGVLQGKATYYKKNGYKEERNYVNGVLEGKVVIHNNNIIEEKNYVNGMPEGNAICRFNNGDYEERNYVNGVLQGKATYYKKNEYKEERSYVKGILQGKVIRIFSNGDREEGEYIKGKYRFISTTQNNIIKDIIKEYYNNGILKSKITEYEKIESLKNINPYFEEEYRSFIKTIYEEYDEKGILTNIIGYGDERDKYSYYYFSSFDIKYLMEKIYSIKISFNGIRKIYYYKNEKLEKTVLQKKKNNIWIEDEIIYHNKEYKDPYYHNGEDKEQGFFDKTFHRLGSSLSKKIKETDFKDVLINLNNTLNKYKK